MASGKTLNAANLETLGAARLAALLIEISTGSAAAKRRLRLALAGNAGPAEASREVGKRLASIAKARGFMDAQQVKSLAADLESQRRAILDLLAPGDPREAFELLWQLVGCAQSVFARSDDRSGRLTEIFQGAVRDLGPLAQAAKLDPVGLAERAFEALRRDQYDTWDALVPTLAPQLGVPGLARIKTLMQAFKAQKVPVPPERERRVVGWSSSGNIYADQIESSHRRSVASFVLQQIADAQGNVDGYIAQIDLAARKTPLAAAAIARRLLDAGRPTDAKQALEAVDPARRARAPIEWEQAHLDTLEALNRAEQAQDYRWQRFLDTLNETHLREHLRRLPDFEDFEAEQRALAHALTYRDVHQALAFLVNWPALHQANELVLAEAHRLNGDLYEFLSPAADALDDKYPLAATLLRRAMIDFTLEQTRATRYKHAARHLADCASLASRITDFNGKPDHAAYAQGLRTAHGRKAAFWQEVERFR
ncbi:DUF6880 family protein [Lichenicoccus sp.]|uniref:DUF6880 family protein n=1 Tax=Lichenicoccus sp. TaxID=2781899 RepID=UPI003D0B49DE